MHNHKSLKSLVGNIKNAYSMYAYTITVRAIIVVSLKSFLITLSILIRHENLNYLSVNMLVERHRQVIRS